MPSLRDLGEFEVLRRLAAARARGSGVIVDAGDDAAVLEPRPGLDLVATTDAFVEGRHVLPEWIAPRALGARLAAANLSDLAAMAATPRWALLSLGLRAEHDVHELLSMQRGLAETLERCGAALVGGNLTAVEGAEWFSLALLGEVARPRVWTRSGARPGDLIAVTGMPGRAGAALRLVSARGAEARAEAWRPLLEAWLEPEPRVGFAGALAATGAVTAAIDLSDGVAGDLAHLCEASGLGAELDAAAWPSDPQLERAAETFGVPVSELWLGPSDDYELLLAVDPAARDGCTRVAAAHGVPLAFAGRFTESPGELMLRERDGARRPIVAVGFDHFGPAPNPGR